MRTTVPELFTSSYGRWRPSEGLLVRTSLGRPRWYPNAGQDLPVLRDLMPEGWMLHRDDWATEYEAMLERRGPDRIANALAAVADEHNAERLVLATLGSGSPPSAPLSKRRLNDAAGTTSLGTRTPGSPVAT